MVFANANIEGIDLVDSVREPGGNITGVRYPGPDLAIKRFEIMLELAPQAERIVIPYKQGYPIIASQLDALHTAAMASGKRLVEIPSTGAADLQADLDARANSGNVDIDAMLIVADPLVVSPDAFTVLGAFAAKHNIPFGGALMSIGGYSTIFGISTDNATTGKQVAPIADKILKGTPAGTIPVVSAESLLKINYRAVQALGLAVPDGLLSRADEIIR